MKISDEQPGRTDDKPVWTKTMTRQLRWHGRLIGVMDRPGDADLIVHMGNAYEGLLKAAEFACAANRESTEEPGCYLISRETLDELRQAVKVAKGNK